MSAGLDDVVKQCRGKNLFLSTDVEKMSMKLTLCLYPSTHRQKTRSLRVGKATYLRIRIARLDDCLCQ